MTSLNLFILKKTPTREPMYLFKNISIVRIGGSTTREGGF